MKTIPLTQGQVALVDDEDFEELSQYNWCAIKAHRSFYAVRTKYCRGKRTIYMHHQIIGKPLKGFHADHLDDNGLNNQRNNLNFVTHRENVQYARYPGKTSSYPGVSRDRGRGKWRADIQVEGHGKFLGHFTNEKEAAQAYRNTLKGIDNYPLPCYDTIEEAKKAIRKATQREKEK